MLKTLPGSGGMRGTETLGFLISILFASIASALAGTDSHGPQNDKRLLGNIDALKSVAPAGKSLPALDQLNAELANLWDWEDQGKRPLNPEVVFSAVKNGYKTEGIYINGYGDANGQDRVFFYYSRPESSEKKHPLFIELTGGGEADRSAWIAKTYQCGVIDIEWRAFKNKFHSKWAGGKLGSMKDLNSLKSNMAFRLVCGIRRAIDFAATQPGTDMERLGCGGGSMGGYFTLLAAGVDQRIRFGMDELGAGYLGQTDSSLGQFDLPTEHKAIWLKAFDPYSYARQTRARMLMNLAANDYFFWLGDGIQNFQALAGEKTLCISPNFNHADGCYGTTKCNPMDWLPYALGLETNYPAIASVTQDGATYRVRTKPGVPIQSVTLYWSPGRDIVWPARYWLAVPAVLKDGVWQAEIPDRFAALERYAFMSVRSDKGRTVSSLPSFKEGLNPQLTAGGWWPRGQVWDVQEGPGSWRPVGPNRHSGMAPARVNKVDSGGISIVPEMKPRHGFSLVNSSITLAAGEARSHSGLRIELDAGTQPGELTVSLVRNFAAVKAQLEFSFAVRYVSGKQCIEIPWSEFKCKADLQAKLFPFDNLRLDGTRTEGSTLVIHRITFF